MNEYISPVDLIFLLVLIFVMMVSLLASIAGGTVLVRRGQSFWKGAFLGAFTGFIVAIVSLAVLYTVIPFFVN